MRPQIIDNWAELPLLETEWNNLLRRSQADCPFLTWEWVQSWRAVVGETLRLMVVAARDVKGMLAGIGPFYLGGFQLGGAITYRALRMPGDYHTGAEYFGWIVHEDCEWDATVAIARTLANIGERWDCLWMRYVSGWTGARERIVEAFRALSFYCHERPCQFASLELPGNYGIYEGSLSPNTRASLRRRKWQVFALAGASVERCEAEEGRAAILDALFRLNDCRWRANGKVGTFVRKPLEGRFYREFTRVALERGWLRLFALKVGGESKAVQIGYVYNGTFYQLQEGFEPEGPPGIGNVLRSKVIEHCIAEGVRTYDFLGECTEHKRRWLAKPRVGHDLFVGRRGSLKNALLFSAKVWPTGRYLRPVGLPSGTPARGDANGATGGSGHGTFDTGAGPIWESEGASGKTGRDERLGPCFRGSHLVTCVPK